MFGCYVKKKQHCDISDQTGSCSVQVLTVDLRDFMCILSNPGLIQATVQLLHCEKQQSNCFLMYIYVYTVYMYIYM